MTPTLTHTSIHTYKPIQNILLKNVTLLLLNSTVKKLNPKSLETHNANNFNFYKIPVHGKGPFDRDIALIEKEMTSSLTLRCNASSFADNAHVQYKILPSSVKRQHGSNLDLKCYRVLLQVPI